MLRTACYIEIYDLFPRQHPDILYVLYQQEEKPKPMFRDDMLKNSTL